MKTIGLLGGMSWESTADYYRLINQAVKFKLGGLHSAKIALYSVDFSEIEQLQQQGDWISAGKVLSQAAMNVEKADADLLLICTNTMHIVFDEIAQSLAIPVLHIADATGEKLKQRGIKRVGLLGTAFTMEKPFYKARLQERYGVEVIIPSEEARQHIHRIIFTELCLGKISPQSKQYYLSVIKQLADQGAEGIILGCTEIGMLVNQSDTTIPLFDTTQLHVEQAVTLALADK